MPQQTIGLGTAANDGTGDTLRSAGTKLNANFTELYGSFVKHNFLADGPPAAANDTTQGYSAGSYWMHDETGDMWRCRSAATGDARWIKIDVSDHPGYLAGNWIGPTFPLLNGAAIGNGTLRLIPLTIKQRVTISELGARITTAASGGMFGIAVYPTSVTTKKATGTPVASVVGLSTTTATIVTAALGAPVAIEAGNYWVGGLSDNATAVFQTIASGALAGVIGDPTPGNVLAGGTNGLSHLSVSTSYAGGFPDLTGVTQTPQSNNASLAGILKIASVP